MEKIKKKLDEMYQDERTRSFIMHLVRAYFPSNRVVQFERDDLAEYKSDKHIKCCITGVPLVTYDTCNELLMDKYYNGALFGKNTSAIISHYAYDGLQAWIADQCMNHDKYIYNIVNEEMLKEIDKLPEGDLLRKKITNYKNVNFDEL